MLLNIFTLSVINSIFFFVLKCQAQVVFKYVIKKNTRENEL